MKTIIIATVITVLGIISAAWFFYTDIKKRRTLREKCSVPVPATIVDIISRLNNDNAEKSRQTNYLVYQFYIEEELFRWQAPVGSSRIPNDKKIGDASVVYIDPDDTENWYTEEIMSILVMKDIVIGAIIAAFVVGICFFLYMTR